MRRFVAFDVETTGLHGFFDRVVEVGAVRFDLGGPGETFQSLVDPGRPIPPETTVVHGIDDRKVAGAPTFEEVAPELIRFFGEATIVAHNAPFDLSFLLASCQRGGIDPPRSEAVDSIRLARAAFPEMPGYSLDLLVGRLGIERERGHRALPDAFAAARLSIRAMEALGARDGEGVERVLAEVGPPAPIGSFGYEADPVLPEGLAAIGDALREGGNVRVLYEDGSGRRTERVLAPLRIARVRSTLFMDAACSLRGSVLCFRLDRVREVLGRE
ncbi:MAG: WYL domain-containing protein [Candidatus Eisenbacteria bacterium]|nr:WYL domain-containing protein [Candidatus Eisenbacteria bacterium]